MIRLDWAIDLDDFSGDVGGIIGREIADEPSNLLGPTDAAERDTTNDFLRGFGAPPRQCVLSHRGIGKAN